MPDCPVYTYKDYIEDDLLELSHMNGLINFLYIQPCMPVQGDMLPKINLTCSADILVKQAILEMYSEFVDKKEGGVTVRSKTIMVFWE